MSAAGCSSTIPAMSTVKLSYWNYLVWKTQMIPLMSYHNLLPHIDGSSPSPEPRVLTQDDKQVPNPSYSTWHSADLKAIVILQASLSEEEMAKIIGLTTAHQIWLALESAYSNITPAEQIEIIQRRLRYSEKGSMSVATYGRKFQGYCDQLAAIGHPVDESEKLDRFLNGLGAPFNEFSRDVRETEPVPDFRDVLAKAQRQERDLESKYKPTLMNKVDDPALDAIAPVVSALREDLQYIQASSINVSNFVNVKLSDRSTYHTWNRQMTNLIESQDLLHIIHPRDHPFPGDKGVHKIKQYDQLVKCWILGSMNENVLKYFIGMETARKVWNRVVYKFNGRMDLAVEQDEPDSVEFMFQKDLFIGAPEIGNTRTKERLYEAAVEGCWWKAKYLLRANKNAATEAITKNGDTILHLAVEMGQNHFVEKLLEFLKDIKDIKIKNSEGQTALHIAAMVGNEYATQLLLQKSEKLSETLDNNEKSPLDTAISQSKLNVSSYLLKFISSDLSSSRPTLALFAAIILKQYDLVLTSLKKKGPHSDYEQMLLLITITFPSDLDFKESLIYPSFNSVRQKAVKRCSLLFHPSFWDKCVDDILRAGKIYNIMRYSWFGNLSIILLVPIATLYPIYQLICLLILGLHLTLSLLYLLLWKVLVLTFHPIKNIEKRKKEYGDAKEILSFIISRIGSSKSSYKRSILEAVRIGAYEVVDEILFALPSTINSKDEHGHNIIQLAIINRSEKVYNLIHHIIMRTESYRKMVDSFGNNLVHLTGRLAPSFVLGRTTGAALQLQRELLWQKV